MRFERFDTPGQTDLKVSLAAADLSVSTWDDPATEVEVGGRRDDEATRLAIENFSIAMHQRGQGHEVVVRESQKPHFGFRLRDPSLTVRIRCPHGSGLSVTSGSSDVSCAGTLGPVDVKTGSGDVELEGSAAALRVTSASGDVHAELVEGQVSVTTASGDTLLERAIGEVGLNSVSGDIELREARGAVKTQSVSGDVSVVALGGGDVRAQTVSGDVRIALAPGVAVWIDAGSVSGDVTSSLDVGDESAVSGEERVVEVRVKTVSGDVVISRARGAAV